MGRGFRMLRSCFRGAGIWEGFWGGRLGFRKCSNEGKVDGAVGVWGRPLGTGFGLNFSSFSLTSRSWLNIQIYQSTFR